MSFSGFIDFFQKGKVSAKSIKLPTVFWRIKCLWLCISRLLDQKKSFHQEHCAIHYTNMLKRHWTPVLILGMQYNCLLAKIYMIGLPFTVCLLLYIFLDSIISKFRSNLTYYSSQWFWHTRLQNNCIRIFLFTFLIPNYKTLIKHK